MVDSSKRARGLGRGLSALMADVAPSEATTTVSGGSTTRQLPIDSVVPNPDQPRKTFAEPALEELAASIREKGIIQPLIVRQIGEGDTRFEIVAGERRWRAAQRAQLHEVPVVVRSFTDTEVLEIAIIENIQRADLNPIEEALGYRQLIERFQHTQEQLAQALGKSRSHIANLMRLLTLPEPVMAMLRDGTLSAGHARALITASDPIGLARKVVKEGLSVRQTERLAKAESTTDKPRETSNSQKDADTRALEGDLSAQTGMKVVIEHGPSEGGKLTLSYRTLDDLDRLCAALSAMPRGDSK